MSFIRIDNGNLEYTGVQLNPKVEFLSSSLTGELSGRTHVAPVRPKSIKVATFEILDQYNIIKNKHNNQQTFFNEANHLLSLNGAANQSAKNSKQINIQRFDQPSVFDSNQIIKSNIVNVLMPYHEHRYQNCNYSYSNYHTLNFFKSSKVPTGSALLYSNNGGRYDMTGAFSLNFWVNPRYSEQDYTPGTIFHLSSSIAVSLVKGNKRDENNEISDFKLLLQLSSSADLAPSSINVDNITNELVFTSSNYLNKNHWHHVCIQWGGKYYQNYTGSIYIDEIETNFAIPSQSLGNNNVSGLVIGNYYKGNFLNLKQLTGTDASAAEGYTASDTSGNPPLLANTFEHPLQAEVHEIKMFNKVLNTNVQTGQQYSEKDLVKLRGLTSLTNCQLYIPPFFNPNVNSRTTSVSTIQGVSKTSSTPFNESLSFRLNAHLLNLENFVSEFIYDTQPRLINLKESVGSNQTISGDEFVYSSQVLRKRNLSILPNDNGLFSPRYDIYSLKSILDPKERFTNPGLADSNLTDYSIINLENLTSTASYNAGLSSPQDVITGTFSQNIDNVSTTGFIGSNLGPNPFVPTRTVVEPYKWLPQHTRDVSSCEFVCYNVSDLYYGNRINPSTLEIFDNSLTGSGGKIKIRLKDNGVGSIYRADCLTKQATWNNVGNVFYNEGLIFIKSPHLHHFCKDRTDLKFRGDQNLHTMIINIPAYKDLFNSSSNPTYSAITPSENANDLGKSSVYITTVNIHDNNFNIIMKANFSQPIVKTDEDEFVIRLKEDF
jgi:hypothetical protein